jgi:hypothetical protein
MRKMNMSVTDPETEPSLLALNLFARQAGLSPITVWRWRKKGWFKTVNIAGRQYVRSEDLAEFKRRAAAGEFAQEHKVPRLLPLSGNTPKQFRPTKRVQP